MVDKRSRSPEPVVSQQSVEPTKKKPRLPKRKVALQIGYCGTGYHGMQLNPPQKTIEGDIFAALVKAGAISEDNSDDPKKSSLLRAARTDKGVHAAGNVISLKMIIEDPEIIQKINAELPEQIRVWGYTRTNRAFDCRKLCSSRVYEYVLPTYTLMNPSSMTALGKAMREKTARLNRDCTSINSALALECHQFWDKIINDLQSENITPEDAVEARKQDLLGTADDITKKNLAKIKQIENKHRRCYRVLPQRLELFREILKQYEGVHNFHNFTVKKHHKDPSAMRNMKTLQAGDPFVIDSTEWISVKIHGQSFMLHQIRKMIALAVLMVRTNSSASMIASLFDSTKISIPKAPALGLLLERPVYDAYNQRLGQMGRDHIEFDQFEEQIEKFKHKFIYDRIYKQEAEENDFNAFFGYMDTYRLQGILDYLLGIESVAEPGTELDEVDSESDANADNDDNEG